MTASTRRRANDITDAVNHGIHQSVVKSGPEVQFVDWDKLYEGRRFCEASNADDPIGSNNPNVFFNDLTTILPVPGLADVAKQTPGLKVDITDVLQQSSVFHPKIGAHKILAAELNFGTLIDAIIPVSYHA